MKLYKRKEQYQAEIIYALFDTVCVVGFTGLSLYSQYHDLQFTTSTLKDNMLAMLYYSFDFPPKS